MSGDGGAARREPSIVVPVPGAGADAASIAADEVLAPMLRGALAAFVEAIERG
jgi:hypothetical protein